MKQRLEKKTIEIPEFTALEARDCSPHLLLLERLYDRMDVGRSEGFQLLGSGARTILGDPHSVLSFFSLSLSPTAFTLNSTYPQAISSWG